MTPGEFEMMGGKQPPAGYDPEAQTTVEREGYSSGRIVKGKAQTFRPVAVIHKVTVNETDTDQGWTTVGTDAIQALAEAHQVNWLTINWPDKYSPDFTAVPA